MSSLWLTHHHSHGQSPVHRLPAGLKLGGAFLAIVGTVLAPPDAKFWYSAVAASLILVLIFSRLPVVFVLKRLLALSPFVLGVAVVNAWQPAARVEWHVLAMKSGLCLTTVILVSNTTPFSKMLRVLQQLKTPGLLVTTIALMHRYLFVLVEEADRMKRARLSRTFNSARGLQWRSLSTVIGQLFIRASERAERIYDAMCSRGWR
jgi:cobalt/nickel transport system permease protein